MRVFLASIPLPGTIVVVIGDDHAAAAKARLFRGSGAVLRWFIGPQAGSGPEAEAGHDLDPAVNSGVSGEVSRVARWPTGDDLANARLVFITVFEPRLRLALVTLAKASGAQVNVVDQPALSDFHTPALIDRDGVVVGVATGGAAPVLAREVRSRIEAALPAGLDRLARLAEGLRQTVIETLPDFTSRRRFWEAAFRGPARDLAVEGRAAEARRHMLRLLNTRETAVGIVHLVGAGPGDPELLTLKALTALQDADVIIHDRLTPAAILDRARRDAVRIYVGKQRGDHSVPQAEIAQLMIAEARKGHRVVRLKGGDPFIFGRGGEELAAVRAAGIDVIVIPGVTAALGCAAAVGIPLTYRDQAQAVTFVTAEVRDGGSPADWSSLGAANHTLAVYMGVGAAPQIQAGLLAAGRTGRTPVAVIENGSLPDQRTVTGRLDDLASLICREAIASPALLIIGEVAAWAETGSVRQEVAA